MQEFTTHTRTYRACLKHDSSWLSPSHDSLLPPTASIKKAGLHTRLQTAPNQTYLPRESEVGDRHTLYKLEGMGQFHTSFPNINTTLERSASRNEPTYSTEANGTYANASSSEACVTLALCFGSLPH